MLFIVIAASWVFSLLLPTFRIAELSVFSLLGGAAAIFLVGHIFFNVTPADRAARDKRNSSEQDRNDR